MTQTMSTKWPVAQPTRKNRRKYTISMRTLRESKHWNVFGNSDYYYYWHLALLRVREKILVRGTCIWLFFIFVCHMKAKIEKTKIRLKLNQFPMFMSETIELWNYVADVQENWKCSGYFGYFGWLQVLLQKGIHACNNSLSLAGKERHLRLELNYLHSIYISYIFHPRTKHIPNSNINFWTPTHCFYFHRISTTMASKVFSIHVGKLKINMKCRFSLSLFLFIYFRSIQSVNG